MITRRSFEKQHASGAISCASMGIRARRYKVMLLGQRSSDCHFKKLSAKSLKFVSILCRAKFYEQSSVQISKDV